MTLLLLCALYAAWQLNVMNKTFAGSTYEENRVNVYKEAADLAATIATSTDQAEQTAALDRFKHLNNGALVLFSDETVSWAAALLLSCIDDPEDDRCKERDLNQLASGLNKAMRRSLLDGAQRAVNEG
jgi:hypothetical protein